MKLEEPMNYEEIKVAVKRSIRKITKTNFINYFDKVYTKTNILRDMKKTSKYHKKPKVYKA